MRQMEWRSRRIVVFGGGFRGGESVVDRLTEGSKMNKGPTHGDSS